MASSPMLPLAVLMLLGAASPPAPTDAQASPTPSPTAPARFELQWRVDWNRHGGDGADNEHLQSKVVLTLLDGDGVRIEDQGTRSRGVLTQAWGYREEEERWRTVWEGTRQLVEGKLLLDLTVQRRSCQVIETEEGREATVSPCKKPRPLRLVCTTVEVKAGQDYITPEKQRQSYTAWLCTPGKGAQSPAAGASPTPWWFGKQVCIESTQGPPGGINHRRCPRK